MVSSIQPDSSNTIEQCSLESTQEVLEHAQPKDMQNNQSSGPFADQKMEELLSTVRREAEIRYMEAQSVLKAAVRAQDIQAFSEFCAKGNVSRYILLDVYVEAVHNAPIDFIRQLEVFLFKQDASLIEFLLENLRDSKSIQALMTSPNIDRSENLFRLRKYFEKDAICKMPRRLEIAQILINHGTDPFFLWGAWDKAFENKDMEGLRFLMKHPHFPSDRYKYEYILEFSEYNFHEKFNTPKIWSDAYKRAILEDKDRCELYRTLGLVPTNDEVPILLEKNLRNPRACLLPFIDHKIEGLSLEIETEAAMGFLKGLHDLKRYPFKEGDIVETIEPIINALVQFDPRIIAKRILSDAFWEDPFSVRIDDISEIARKEAEESDEGYIQSCLNCSQYLGVVVRAHGYYLLSQYKHVRAELLKLEGGKECLAKIEAVNQAILQAFGPRPWYIEDEYDCTSKLINIRL